MDFQTIQAGFQKLVSAAQALLEAHPDLESDAANTLRDVTNEVAPIATQAVDASVTPTAADAIDAAIAKIKADADATAEKVAADAKAKIDAMLSAKAALTDGG